MSEKWSMGAIEQQQMSSKRVSKSRITLVILMCSAALILLYYRPKSYNNEAVLGEAGLRYQLPGMYDGNYNSVPLNQTLGFQKAFVISLPSRYDNRDILSVLRHSSGIDLEVVEGVYGTEAVNNRLSYWDPKHMRPGAIGSFRSHIDVWKRLVDEKIESALIFEEDIDWVDDLKGALQKLQHPFTSLLTSHKSDGEFRYLDSQDPWNHNEWDVLYLGACHERSFTKKNARPWAKMFQKYNFVDEPPFLVYQDDTSPDTDQLRKPLRDFLADYEIPKSNKDMPKAERKRIVTRSYEPWCTTGYAVSLRGAFRLLYGATITMNEPADVSIGFNMQNLLIEGYSVIPPLFGQWTPEKANVPSDRELMDGRKANLTKGGNNFNPWKGKSQNIGPSFRQHLAEKEDLYNT
jgi:GR25 family glycosyltransferase involved in LPS biosynthesis